MKNIHIKKLAAVTVMMGMMLTSTACSGQADLSADGFIREAINDTSVSISAELASVAAASAEEITSHNFALGDKSDEEIVIGGVKVGTIFDEIRTVRSHQADHRSDLISIDCVEYCDIRGEKADVCYAFKDLNGDGTDELVLADENGYPMGIYMEKNGSLHVPDLIYYRGGPKSIRADGVINTMQGQFTPEGHEDGFFYKIDPAASDGIVETQPGTDEPMQFDWKVMP